jgi:predicted homoserine dehydrogenase-like protein
MLLLGHWNSGDGSTFFIHISRVPLQGICRTGQTFQEATQNQRHVTECKDNATFEETIKAGQLLQKEKVKIIQNHSLDCVMNTDQTGCKNHVNIRRRLSNKEGKKK